MFSKFKISQEVAEFIIEAVGAIIIVDLPILVKVVKDKMCNNLSKIS